MEVRFRRGASFLLSILVLVFAQAACGHDSMEPTPVGYAGEWIGTTAQGTPVRFSVSGDVVTSISITYNFSLYGHVELHESRRGNSYARSSGSAAVRSARFWVLHHEWHPGNAHCRAFFIGSAIGVRTVHARALRCVRDRGQQLDRDQALNADDLSRSETC